MQRVIPCFFFSFLLVSSFAAGATFERGALVREATIYISPDAKSAKLGSIARGFEVVIIESGRDWLHVTADLTEARQGEDDEEVEGKTITGWILGKGVIRATTPNGERILYGEAIDSEDQASRSRGRRGAAKDATRLYARVAEYFPNSPLAAEALYRSADDQWQIEKDQIASRPSAHAQEAYLRGQMDEHRFKEVLKKFPATKWADLAAFHLLDNKLCGDWQGNSKCPNKEADLYEKYAADRPQSPAAAESLYSAAWRRSALIEIYKTEAQPKKSTESKEAAADLCRRVLEKYPQSDYASRAQRLLYLVEQEVPTYGNSEE
jgi:outer membrane protein assembly factor BamD (BamD/ComL family)